MGILIALVLGVAILMPISSAQADWYIPYYRAQNIANRDARESCAEERECAYWSVGRCARINQKRFNCWQSFWYPDYSLNESIRCDNIIKIGVGVGGYIKRTYSKPECYWEAGV